MKKLNVKNLTPYNFALKVINTIKNKGRKDKDIEFILNTSDTLETNNITGKKVYFDKDNNPTLDINKAIKYKWLPFKDTKQRTGINPFFTNEHYVRTYGYSSEIVKHLKFEIEQIEKKDKQGNTIFDKDEKPVLITKKSLVECDANESTIVQVFDVNVSFVDKDLYNFKPTTEEIQSLSSDKATSDIEDEYTDEIEFL